MSEKPSASISTPDKRKLRGQETRRQILQAAIACVATDGLGKLTLDRVAKHAGITRGLVVFHFKSKTRLIEEVLRYLGQQYEDGWNAVLNQESGSSLEKLLQLTDFDVCYCYQNPVLVSVWHAFWGEARGNILYHDMTLPQEECYAIELEQLVAGMVAESNQDAEELPMIMAGLYTMLFGIWLESHLCLDAKDCDLYLNTVRHYLAKNFPTHDIPPLPPSS